MKPEKFMTSFSFYLKIQLGIKCLKNTKKQVTKKSKLKRKNIWYLVLRKVELVKRTTSKIMIPYLFGCKPSDFFSLKYKLKLLTDISQRSVSGL